VKTHAGRSAARRTVDGMDVTFHKRAHAKDYVPWIATRGKTRIVGSHLGSDPRHLPHDVITFVVERELDIQDGFFATVAAGGTFRSMRKRRHATGKAVIAANRTGLDQAERRVNQTWQGWREGRPGPCNAALDEALEAWMALPPGGELTLSWPSLLSPRRGPRAGAGRGRRR
jgi:hypothetical protein